MKNKISFLFALWMLVCLAPELLADINITAFDAGGGRLTIGYQATGDAIPVGFGLRIHLSDGATVGNGDVVSVDSHFPLYIDYVFSNPFEYNIGDGHPLANQYEAGIPGSPTSDFSLCLSAFTPYFVEEGAAQDLNGDRVVDAGDVLIFAGDWLIAVEGQWPPTDFNQDAYVNLDDLAILAGPEIVMPGTVVNLVTLQLNDGGAGYTDVIIEPDVLRGGMVGMGIGTIFMPDPIHVIIPEPATMSLLAIGSLAALLRKRK